MKVYYEIPERAKKYSVYIDDLVLGYLRRHSPSNSPIEKVENSKMADEIVNLLAIFDRIAAGE